MKETLGKLEKRLESRGRADFGTFLELLEADPSLFPKVPKPKPGSIAAQQTEAVPLEALEVAKAAAERRPQIVGVLWRAAIATGDAAVMRSVEEAFGRDSLYANFQGLLVSLRKDTLSVRSPSSPPCPHPTPSHGR